MVVGFNHNIRYRNQLFHIQTEDSGIRNPNIITLLYVGGTILASQKTSYADITKVDNLEAVVEELMKEQHKNMLRRLKNGEFDETIAAFLAGKPLPAQAVPEAAAPKSPRPAGGSPSAPSPASGKEEAAVVEHSLDEIILSYLVGEERKNK